MGSEKAIFAPKTRSKRSNQRQGGGGGRRGGGSDVGGALSDKTAVEEEKLLTGAGFIRWNLSWIQIKRRYRGEAKEKVDTQYENDAGHDMKALDLTSAQHIISR